MLTRALLVLLGMGLAASAASRDYNSNDNYMGARSRPEINQTKIFCYLNATRIMNKNSRFRLENLNIDMCTHVVYGAAYINGNNEVEPISHDLERGSGAITFAQLNEYKKNKNVKTILSIHGSHYQFSTMARGFRSPFINSVLNYLNRHEFDGVNIDWQYPGRHGGNAVDDKQNYNLLIKELKHIIRGSGKLLTVSLPPTQPALNDGFDYDNDTMLENVDYWFIMALEYYNHHDYTIGANAPIIGNDGHHDVTSTINFIKSKERLRRDSLKLILVVPFYGKQYLLSSELKSGESPIGQPFVNKNSGIDSVLSYHDVCDIMKSATSETWMRAMDPNSKTPYAVNGKRAILFEDPMSVAEKTNLALKNNLGGVMAYSLDLDDFDGRCAMDHSVRTSNNNYNNKYNPSEHSSSYKYPLLQAMYDTVQRGPNSSAATGPLSVLVVFLATALLTIHG